MDKKEILEKLNTIFIDVLDNPKIVLEAGTTAHDIEEWDSLAHIHLVVAIERQFKIRFTSKEIQGWDNIGDLTECISEKV